MRRGGGLWRTEVLVIHRLNGIWGARDGVESGDGAWSGWRGVDLDVDAVLSTSGSWSWCGGRAEDISPTEKSAASPAAWAV